MAFFRADFWFMAIIGVFRAGFEEGNWGYTRVAGRRKKQCNSLPFRGENVFKFEIHRIAPTRVPGTVGADSP